MTAEVQEQLLEARVIAILRGDYRKVIIPLVQSLYEGGIRAVEVTMNSAGAIDLIQQLVLEFGDKMLIGGGTVLTREHVTSIAQAGGRFVVSPDTYPVVIEAALKEQLVPIPGAFTPTEIMTARRSGAELVKLFPASQGGPGYLKNILPPLDDAKLFPTGGITLENARDYMDAGAAGIGIGSQLIPKQFNATEEECNTITDKARQLIKNLE